MVDAEVQQRFECPEFKRPAGDWDLISGELMGFEWPEQVLPPIDRLEGFRPGEPSLYQRVLVPVLSDGLCLPAWTYWMVEPRNGKRIQDGEWRRWADRSRLENQ